MTTRRSEMEQLTDVSAEQAVCGAILLDPDILLKLAGMLGLEDFTNEKARWVYEAALALYEQQQPIDNITVCDMLSQKNHLEQVGGAAYLSELTLATPTALHAERYGETLKRLSVRRDLVRFAQATAKLAYSANGASTSEIVEKVRAMIDGVAPTMSTEDTLLWKDSIERFVQVQMARANQQALVEQGKAVANPGLRLPWENTLRRFKLKIRPGTVALIVAGSGVGKTSLMETCAEYWAGKQDKHVVFFHLELSRQFMLDRRTCRLSGVPLEIVESRMSNEDVRRAKAEMDSYKGSIHYISCPSWSARQIAAKARELHAKGLCDVIIVDYLQKMRLWMPQGYNKSDALADAAEVIKTCCEQLLVEGVVGSQVNKKASEAGRVTAAHVRGTGEADEKFNITMILTREILLKDINDGEYEAGELSPIMDVRIDKNTGGKTGETKLFMKGERFLVTEIREETYL